MNRSSSRHCVFTIPYSRCNLRRPNSCRTRGHHVPRWGGRNEYGLSRTTGCIPCELSIQVCLKTYNTTNLMSGRLGGELSLRNSSFGITPKDRVICNLTLATIVSKQVGILVYARILPFHPSNGSWPAMQILAEKCTIRGIRRCLHRSRDQSLAPPVPKQLPP